MTKLKNDVKLQQNPLDEFFGKTEYPKTIAEFRDRALELQARMDKLQRLCDAEKQSAVFGR